MKLKQLHIRNIASIESGDIDFENGLIDSATGKAAPLFLISGDTGAGKTVILDCISMALYRQTPRQSSVANKKQNEYRTIEGEALSVSDIRQYTRIGISAKSECYSELVFEGNDGLIYTARLELGMKRKNKEGKGKLQHRDPKWSVRKGEAAPVSGVKEVETIILDAIGITFEQFGRMAMLAQGQFAAFLTGDKKEREAILEQLTNTERFTKYGEAIKNIWSRTKTETESASKTLAAISDQRLSPEDKQLLKEELSKIDAATVEIDKARQELEQRKTAVETVTKRSEEILASEKRIEELKESLDDEAHRKMQQLVSLWDATTLQRQWLTELRKAEMLLTVEETKIPSLHERYKNLSADLAYRLKYQTELWERKEKEEKWLGEREGLRPLYERSQTVIADLKTLISTDSKITSEIENQKNADEESKIIASQLVDQRKLREEASTAVKNKQDEIDAKNAELKEYDLEALSARQSSLLESIASFEKLSKDLLSHAEMRRDLAAHSGSLKKLEEESVDLSPKVEKAEAELKKTREEEQEALKLRDMFGKGLDNAMKALRERMALTHADRCPLCGQSVIGLEGAEELIREAKEKEEKRLKTVKEKVASAESAYNELRERGAALAVSIANEKKSISETERKLKELQDDMALTSSKLKIPVPQFESADTIEEEPYSHTEQVIGSAKTECEKSLETVKGKIAAANLLSSGLRKLNEERKPLDKRLEKADLSLKEIERRSEKLLASIEQIKKNLETLNQEKERLKDELTGQLDPAYPAWKESLKETADRLKADSSDYESHSRQLDAISLEGEKLIMMIEQINGSLDSITALFPGWAGHASEAIAGEESNPALAWQRLVADCREVTGAISRYKAEKSTANERLGAWTEEQGESLETLNTLIKSEREIKEARVALDQLRQNLVVAQNSSKRLREERMEAYGKLGLAPGDDLPDIGNIQEGLTAIATERDTLTERRGQISERFTRADADEEAYQKALHEYEKLNSRLQEWNLINGYFGGTRFRTLVQSHILRPLLNDANRYLSRITDQYRLTCSGENEQLSVLVVDLYNKGQVRSATVLSGGERFMISLALSLALSSLNRSDMNVDILFIDEGFGTLDEHMLDSVMATLERLQEIAGQAGRRVGVISHREELDERIPVQIRVRKHGDGRSRIEIS